MKVIFVSAAMILMLAGPAYAQSAPTMEQMMDSKPGQAEQERETDKAYKESLKKIPDAKASTDPWGNTRSADTAKTGAKTTAKAAPAKKQATKSSTATK